MSASSKTVWPSGLRRWLKAPVRKGVGSNPTAVICYPRLIYGIPRFSKFSYTACLQPTSRSALLGRSPHKNYKNDLDDQT